MALTTDSSRTRQARERGGSIAKVLELEGNARKKQRSVLTGHSLRWEKPVTGSPELQPLARACDQQEHHTGPSDGRRQEGGAVNVLSTGEHLEP